MEKQIIIAIGREYGSGGHLIGQKIAEKYGIPFYDRNLLEEVANVKNVDSEILAKYDEKPKKLFFSRTVRGYSNSPSENVAELQFALLKQKAADDDSFVVCGRCADTILKDFKGLLTIFIRGNEDNKIKRIMEVRQKDAKDAKKTIARHDKTRRLYHNHFCPQNPWGETNSYDICVNSSVLGIDGTVDVLCDFIDKFRATL